jgi:hypothetical protein
VEARERLDDSLAHPGIWIPEAPHQPGECPGISQLAERFSSIPPYPCSWILKAGFQSGERFGISQPTKCPSCLRSHPFIRVLKGQDEPLNSLLTPQPLQPLRGTCPHLCAVSRQQPHQQINTAFPQELKQAISGLLDH